MAVLFHLSSSGCLILLVSDYVKSIS
jgi:hypothetical protein